MSDDAARKLARAIAYDIAWLRNESGDSEIGFDARVDRIVKIIQLYEPRREHATHAQVEGRELPDNLSDVMRRGAEPKWETSESALLVRASGEKAWVCGTCGGREFVPSDSETLDGITISKPCPDC